MGVAGPKLVALLAASALLVVALVRLTTPGALGTELATAAGQKVLPPEEAASEVETGVSSHGRDLWGSWSSSATTSVVCSNSCRYASDGDCARRAARIRPAYS
jgi:hypothetical protein